MRKSKWYNTQYTLKLEYPSASITGWKETTYSTGLWATSKTDAIKKARRRGLRERVIGPSNDTYPPCSEVINSPDLSFPEKMHSVVWLSNLAIRSGIATPQDILSDVGIIHLLVHRLIGAASDDPRILDFRVKKLESLVPGYLPVSPQPSKLMKG